MKQELILSGGKKIGAYVPCFIVAEIGNNHQGKLELAQQLIEEAAKSGADAVKFQKRHIPSMLTKQLYNSPYNGSHSFGKTYGEHREALELSVEEFEKLKAFAEDLGLVFFSSVWDEVSLKQMVEIGVEIVKISSADLVNIPLLRKAASTQRIIFLSTGMSTLEEIDKAVSEIKKQNETLVLLHCNSSYPCKEEKIALPVITTLKQRYNTLVGYSGHEKGIGPSIASVALGACVVERHFTLDKTFSGTDHKVSLLPEEFKQMVKSIREVEKAMSIKEKKVCLEEVKNAKKLRKSIVAATNISNGELLTDKNITVKSPGTGLSPIYWDNVIGKKATRDFIKDDFIYLEDLI